MEVNFDQITDSLFVGSRFYPSDWFILADHRITVDVNLMAEAEDRFVGSTPQMYFWLPTPDYFGPGVEAIRIGAFFITNMIKSNHKVYLHCNMGIGRAPTVAIGYMMLQGLSLDAATAYVKEKRPVTKLSGAQVEQLQEFARMIKRNE